MQSTHPHYLLMSETRTVEESPQSGHWRFVLEQIDGSHRVDVSDEEPHVRGERLQLLAVLRGLEALEQPSQVTLITPSRYVGKGLRHGLDFWRENGWCWERFGEMTPIKNRDLWQRIDRSMAFHRIDCRIWNLDRVIGTSPEPNDARIRTRQNNRRLRFDNACHQIGSMARLFAERFGKGGFRAAYGYA
ncbi:MAG: hypothetical protein MK108_10915 [Mariniblastus sp.]|nr:hypothetical protein [Mariniblastus sp.]